MFSDVFLAVDFDRTLTAPDSSVPENNLEAIRWFMANGGAFTVNTGRSVPMCRAQILGKIPVNAPLLLYNGSAAYDPVKGEFTCCYPLPVDPDGLVADLRSRFPELIVEVQGLEGHHVFEQIPRWERFSTVNKCAHSVVDKVPQPLIKLAVYTNVEEYGVPSLYVELEHEQQQLQQVVDYVAQAYGDRLTVFRACPRLVDIHAKGCSKLRIARDVQKQLGRKILVCVGDGDNDLTMLRGADYAFCPADGAVAEEFENVCKCADGAVAEVIYKKIPEILRSLA